MTKTDKKALRGNKKRMYDALMDQLGIITAAARQVGLSRETHYRWLRSDENYKQWIEEIPELTRDFVENALLKNIKEGNVTAQIFYLKTKGRSRGYIERQEIEHKGSEGIKLIIEKANNNEDNSVQTNKEAGTSS